MKKYLCCFLLFVSDVFALEAVITVLEAPLFREKNLESQVVQYFRKGDIIKLHPSLNNNRDIDQYAPVPKKLEELRKRMKEDPSYDDDPLFKGEEQSTYYPEDQFIPIIDRTGRLAYVLSEHIYIYFNDKRELDTQISNIDRTDYRLEEPLPKKYPLKTLTGYRGQFILGMTQPSYESYPYRDDIKTKSYSSPIDLSMTFSKLAPGNYQERLFLGISLNFRYHDNSYSFYDGRTSEEESYKLGLGPNLNYDVFKDGKHRINLSTTIIVHLIDRFYIKQASATEAEERFYKSLISFSPRVGLQYHRINAIDELDLVLGTSMEIGSSTTYQAQNSASNNSWWGDLGEDKFTKRTSFNLSGYFGIQSSY